MTSINLTCVFCGAIAPCDTDEDFDAAMDAGWAPGFWIDGRDVDAEHCGDCAGKHTICPVRDGEPHLIAGHERFLRKPLD